MGRHGLSAAALVFAALGVTSSAEADKPVGLLGGDLGVELPATAMVELGPWLRFGGRGEVRLPDPDLFVASDLQVLQLAFPAVMNDVTWRVPVGRLGATLGTCRWDRGRVEPCVSAGPLLELVRGDGGLRNRSVRAGGRVAVGLQWDWQETGKIRAYSEFMLSRSHERSTSDPIRGRPAPGGGMLSVGVQALVGTRSSSRPAAAGSPDSLDD